MDYKKDNKVLLINSLIKIKTYYEKTDEHIIEDVGILASYDPAN